MRLLLWFALLLALVLVVNSNPVAKPIHGVIKYYKKQEVEKERQSHSRLRHRCESQLISGFDITRECQRWISEEYLNSSSKTSISLGLTLFASMLIFVF